MTASERKVRYAMLTHCIKPVSPSKNCSTHRLRLAGSWHHQDEHSRLVDREGHQCAHIHLSASPRWILTPRPIPERNS